MTVTHAIYTHAETGVQVLMKYEPTEGWRFGSQDERNKALSLTPEFDVYNYTEGWGAEEFAECGRCRKQDIPLSLDWSHRSKWHEFIRSLWGVAQSRHKHWLMSLDLCDECASVCVPYAINIRDISLIETEANKLHAAALVVRKKRNGK